MAVLQLHIPHSHRSVASLSPFTTFTSKLKPFCISFANPSSSSITHQRYPLFTSNDRDRLLSLSTTIPRKLLCKPPQGKFVREDYLVKKLSADEVQELVRGERNVPLIIDFYATWCGPCILMAQELEMLAVEYESNAMIVKVDTDDEYEFARDMQVRGLPTLFFISPDPNKEAIRTEGLIPIQMMRDILDKEM
ncbi:thioredoxin-like protein CITRX, chloroplastic [Neltuma alba]|uniref:thioredoxin-like protein CITRX, chloroplastic n=1 Tax=Neltuma alba TaxID=207710 RepID=UPI0010A41455|nr:thioredoxin-like protein CITRX, chloroplastic [Prosopis alba]